MSVWWIGVRMVSSWVEFLLCDTVKRYDWGKLIQWPHPGSCSYLNYELVPAEPTGPYRDVRTFGAWCEQVQFSLSAPTLVHSLLDLLPDISQDSCTKIYTFTLTNTHTHAHTHAQTPTDMCAHTHTLTHNTADVPGLMRNIRRCWLFTQLWYI